MNELGHDLTHTIVMSLLKDVIISPGLTGMGGPYAATVHVAKNTAPEPGHAHSLTCRGDTPLDAAWSLYYALYEWCREPLSDRVLAEVHRAKPPERNEASTRVRRSGGGLHDQQIAAIQEEQP